MHQPFGRTQIMTAAMLLGALSATAFADVAPPEIGDPETLETVILDHDWDLTRRIMWDYVGIVRSEERLNIARERVVQIERTVERLYSEYGISADMVELRNIALVSSLVVASAMSRKESRGLHYMIDYPAADPAYQRDTVMLKTSDA